MVGAGLADELVAEHLAALPLHQFLEVGLVIPTGSVDLLHAIQQEALDDIPIMGESAVQEHCRQHCFHGIGQDGGTAAAAAGILALAQLQVASQIPLLGHQHQTALADQVGTDAGQVAFGQVGEGAVEVVGHDHAQHGVA